MSNLPDRLRDMARTVNKNDTNVVALLQNAAERIETLESLDRTGLPATTDHLNGEVNRLRDEIARLRDELSIQQKKTQVKEEFIEAIAKAADCTCSQDILVARVSSLHQQSHAMINICEGHIRTCRAAEAKADKALATNAEQAKEKADLQNESSKLRALLHRIADELGDGSRNRVPHESWYTDAINELRVKTNKTYIQNLEASYAQCEMLKNRIAAASAALCIKSVNSSDYVRQLEYLIDETWRYKRLTESDSADRSLCVVPIRRMWDYLHAKKAQTGIGPITGSDDSRLDDIETCLHDYIDEVISKIQQYEADTSFINNVKNSLEHELARRSSNG